MSKKITNNLTLKADQYIKYGLLAIWTIIWLFVFFTLIQPDWLVDISKPGRTEEAQTLIDEGNRIVYEANKTRNQELYKKASLVFRQALVIDSNNFSALGNLAVTYQYMGNAEEAMSIYRKCLQTDSIYTYQSYTYIADLYERKKMNDSSLYYYLKSIDNHIDPAYPMRKSALCYLENQQFDQAYSMLKKALATELSFEKFYKSQLIKAYHDMLFVKDTVLAAKLKSRIEADDFYENLKKLDNISFNEQNKSSGDIAYCCMYMGDLFSRTAQPDSAMYYYQQCLQYNQGLRSVVEPKMRK